MTSIAKQVADIIDDDVIIRRGLEKNIISLRNLAVYLLKEYKLPSTADAVVSAIRRYKSEKPLETKYEHAYDVLSRSKEMKITTNIVIIVLEKNKELQGLLEKVFSLISYEKAELLLINHGELSIKIILNRKNKDAVCNIFSKKNILYIEENIAEITIHLDDEATKTPGIVSVLSTELMIHNINFIEIMSCVPEMRFFVDQKDVVKSYDLLFKICNPAATS